MADDTEKPKPWRIAVWFLFGAVLFGAFLVGSNQAPAHPRTAFFSASAQVIPIVLILLVLEGRLLKLDDLSALSKIGLPGSPGRSMGFSLLAMPRIISLVMLIAGELSALEAVATGSRSNTDAEIVMGALYAGFAGVGLLGLLGTFRLVDRAT